MFADALATSVGTCNIPFNPNNKYEIEVKHRLDVLDNIMYQQVFDNDKQLDYILQIKGEFENLHIDIENIVKDDGKQIVLDQTSENFDIDEIELEVLELKDNVIPRGLVPLEELFDFNDVARSPK